MFSLIILIGRTAPVIPAGLCCSDSAAQMWLCSREFISPLVRIGPGDVQQNKAPRILAGLAGSDNMVS